MKLRVTLGITVMLFLNSVTLLSDGKVTPTLAEESYVDCNINHRSFLSEKAICATMRETGGDKI